MKKNYLYLAAATFLLAGCAQDSFVDENLQETTVPQEIKMSAGNRGISVETRGIGSVGGTNDSQWDGETVKIYAFNKSLSTFNLGAESNDNIFIKGATATVGAGSSQTGISFTEGTKYYPLTGAFNFVGYHADGADKDENGNVAASLVNNNIQIPITIDGSQDIMIAKADLSYGDKEALVEALIKSGKLGNNTQVPATNFIYSQAEADQAVDLLPGDPKPDNNPNDEINEIEIINNEYKKAFSSYTARRQVQPNLVFEHQLVRLNFYVKAGDEKTIASTVEDQGTDQTTGEVTTINKELGVYIKSITVGSRTLGDIKIDKEGGIQFNARNEINADGDYKFLSVGTKNTTTKEIEVLKLTGDELEAGKTFEENKADKVGEGILVMLPVDNKYIAQITTLQKYDAQGKLIATGKQENTYDAITIQKPQKDGEVVNFEAGKSYDVTITVYSNQIINISATLTGWESGGSIEVNPEDDKFNSGI